MSPALAIPCPVGHADAGTPCRRAGAAAYPWYCAARKRAAGVKVPKGGPAPSGHQRGHPERKKTPKEQP